VTLTYFSDNDTLLKEHSQRQYPGEYFSYSDVIVHSHTAPV